MYSELEYDKKPDGYKNVSQTAKRTLIGVVSQDIMP